MALDTSLGTPTGYAWDWTATTHEDGKRSRTELVDDLLGRLEAEVVTIGKGLHGWSRSLVAYDRLGFKTGAVYFGGGRDDVHVVSSSQTAHAARQAVVGVAEARTSRVDTRVDTLTPWDALVQAVSDVAGPRTKVTFMQTTVGGKNEGRTLYVGAPSSSVRVRVYEKWLESPGMYEDGTNRVEVQLRPPSRAKESVSGWGPAETFCASKLTRRLADVLGEDVARPETLQKSKGTPDLERSLEAMGEQYGRTFARWMEFSGGDVGRVLEHLERSVTEVALAR